MDKLRLNLISASSIICALLGPSESSYADLWGDPSSPNLTNESPLTKGWWDSNGGASYPLDLVVGGVHYKPAPIHGSVHPGGEKGFVVLYEQSNLGFFVFDLNNSGTWTRIPVPSTTNQQIYCSGHVVLPNGDFPCFGGDWWDFGGSPHLPADPWAGILDLNPSISYSMIAPMAGLARYYPTCTTLPSGDVLVWGGDYWVGDLDNENDVDPDERFENDTWIKFHMEGDEPQSGVWTEILNPLSLESSNRQVILDRVQLYPYTQVIPASSALASDLTGGGLLWAGPFWKNAVAQDSSSRFFKGDYTTVGIKDKRNYLARGACAMVLLALDMPNPVPRVLLIGGGTQDESGSDHTIGMVEMWKGDVASSSRWNDSSVPDMTYHRHDPSVVLLPDGKVLALGGHACPCQFEDGEEHPYEVIPTLISEMYTPPASGFGGSWALADTLDTPREYHSVGMLLPDGRVVSTGGEPTDEPNHPEYESYEMYYPPYLFINAGGTVRLRNSSERPAIGEIDGHGPSGTTEVYYGYDFEFDVSQVNLDSSFKVVLMRPCSVTHSNDMHQRAIVTEATKVSSTRIRVEGTFHDDDAPPSPYMLFVLDAAGIPSKGKWIRIKHGTPNTTAGNTYWPVGSSPMSISSDVYVQPGDTLFVAAATYQLASSDASPHSKGKDSGKIELIIEGVMKVTAGTSTPAIFKAPSGPSANQWYGIRIAPGGELIVNNTDALDLRNARSPIAWERPAFPDPSWIDEKIKFSADYVMVSFDRDVTIGPGSDIEIPAGWKIGFERGDAGASGRDIGSGELIVLGQLDFTGTSSSPVTLKSARINPDEDLDRWFGVRYLDSTDESLSSLTHVTFDLAKYAISLDSLSGNIFGCTFTNSQLGDIYVDRDTRIPEGYQFSLDAPCKVVVNSDDPAVPTHWGEDPDRVEWWVNGGIKTQRPSGAGSNDRVIITSTEEGVERGDDWYGLTVLGTGFNDGIGVGIIKDAEISYAKFPISLWFADSAEVGNTDVHHYEDDAITDWGSKAWIHDSFIERGSGLDTDDPILGAAGLNGIRLVSSFSKVERDTILYQVNNGIWVDGSEGYCLSNPYPPLPQGTDVIKDCVILGDFEDENATSNGILAEWICHEERVSIEGCNIQQWFGRGIRFNNCADSEIKCNCIIGNKVGFKHDRQERSVTSTNGINVARQNNLADNVDSNMKATDGPDGVSAGILVGVNGNASTGENRFEPSGIGKYNYELFAYTDYDRIDYLENGKWYDYQGNALTTESTINQTNSYVSGAPLDQILDVLPVSNGGDPTCSTGTDDCDISGIAGRHGTVLYRKQMVNEVRSVALSRTSAENSAEEFPSVLALRSLDPNPFHGVVRIGYDVPLGAERGVHIAVYDVQGRRIKDLVELGDGKPGRHQVIWEVTRDSGSAASGVYFIRMTGPQFSETRKIVFLR